MPDENPAIVASETASELSVAGEAHRVRTLRARVLSGSMIMLVSSGFVGAMNLLYNLSIAHALGADKFGHASAVYTVLMLLSSVTLSFQLLCSKYVAKNDSPGEKIGIYHFLHRRAWMYGIGVRRAAFPGQRSDYGISKSTNQQVRHDARHCDHVLRAAGGSSRLDAG